jgi:putative membrane protein
MFKTSSEKEAVMKTFLAMVGAMVLSLACGADTTAGFTLEEPDPATGEPLAAMGGAFLLQASLHMEDELAASRLARRQSRQPQVLQYCERVRSEGLQGRAELEALARPRGVSLARAPSAEAERQLAQLASRNGGAFDRLYLASRMRALSAGMEVFATHASRGRDTELRAWAGRLHGRLRESYDMAANLHQTMYANHGWDNGSGVPFDGSR